MSNLSAETFAARVDGTRLMTTVRALAQWEKLSGTPSELESFKYVKAQLDAAGWTTELIMHDAYISLPVWGRVEIDGLSIDCITHSHAVSAPQGVSGELVYVGAGAAEDFAGQDVTGKIVVIEGLARPDHAHRASKAGAIAQIHIALGRKPHEMCVSPVWGNPSPETMDMLAKTVVVTLSREAGEDFRAKLAAGVTTAKVFAEVDARWTKTPILQADLPAPNGGDAAPYVLFSGHIDTWYYGVMDNGTANATILEVARLVQAEQASWKRGLRLCFWSGHSHGRYSGSAWYADNKWHDLNARCVAHVNVDSTGGKGANVLTNSGTNSELRALATDAVKSQAGQTHAGKRLGRQGDESFWGVGIPAMFGSLSHHAPEPGEKGHSHLGWWWHTDSDTLDNIDEANLVRDTKVFAHLVWRLLTEPVLPIDYRDHLADLKAELAKLGEIFDLSAAAQAADALAAQLAALYDKAQSADAAFQEAFNGALLKVSRALVPMDSTRGDRFVHDPALPLVGWPVLEPVRKLRGLEVGSDDYLFASVSARQSVNRVQHAVFEASAALRALI